MEAEFVKKRLEKDLAELKKMIEKHFEQRKTDEEAITELQTRKGFSILYTVFLDLQCVSKCSSRF